MKMKQAAAQSPKSKAIRQLNDAFRTTFVGGALVLTVGVQELEAELRAQILKAVRGFTDFDEGNDPYNEHDFLSVNVGGTEVFAKIDYMDMAMRHHSPDPSDPACTRRILTIMKAEEY